MKLLLYSLLGSDPAQCFEGQAVDAVDVVVEHEHHMRQNAEPGKQQRLTV